MTQTTIYINDDQRSRIKKLPRDVSFSELVRNKFDVILEDYPDDSDENVMMNTR